MSGILHSSFNLPRLTPGEVHVWYARLDSNTKLAQAMSEILSDDERERARSFVYDRDRGRYIAARGILRCLIGCYIGMDPKAILFTYGACGKPELAISSSREGLKFNVSHADHWALYAVASDREVGIDIEPLWDGVPWRQLAPLVFSSREQAEFAVTPANEKSVAFLRGWTRKEAYVKGRGVGLSLPLQAFDVPLDRRRSPIRVKTANGLSSRWWLYPIDHVPGCTAALAVAGAPVRVSVGHWPDLSGVVASKAGLKRFQAWAVPLDLVGTTSFATRYPRKRPEDAWKA